MSTELARLSDYEERAEEAVKQVNRGMEAFAVELKAIKELGLWKGAYDSFEDYCNLRWGRTVRTVQRALKAHTVRQKLLAVASGPEKQVVEEASTKTLEALPHETTDEQMKALTIGRREPTAKRTADFYSSEPNRAVDGVRDLKATHQEFGPEDCPRSEEEMVSMICSKLGKPLMDELRRQDLAKSLREYPLKDEAHRTYLNHLANCIEKGEPA
jgi:hypothetical protein